MRFHSLLCNKKLLSRHPSGVIPIMFGKDALCAQNSLLTYLLVSFFALLRFSHAHHMLNIVIILNLRRDIHTYVSL